MSSAGEVIKSEILKRSHDEAGKIISEAQEKAQHLISQAEITSDEIFDRTIKPEISVTRKRILGSARLEGRKLVVQARNEMMSRVFKLTEERLRRIAVGKDTEYNYEDLLFQLLNEAAHRLDEKELIVTSNQQTLNELRKNSQEIEGRLRKSLGREISLKVENSPYDCIGGVVARNPTGTRIFYNCLEGRVLRLREALTGNVAEILFS